MKIVCFGELLLRLNAPDPERLLQTPSLRVHVGGAEANVAVSLVQFGHDAQMVSVVAENMLAEAAVGELRRHGVGVEGVQRANGRMGLYFMSTGAVRRPSEILYDRAASAFANAQSDAIDWADALKGVGWLHLSGVTPAVGEHAAKAAVRAARAATDAGVPLSFDGNYRSQLWAAWGGDGPSVLREIMDVARVGFVNERDIDLILGTRFAEKSDRAGAFTAAFEAFAGLQVIACTTREQMDVNDHNLTGELVTREGRWTSRTHELRGIVDRIGAGDAYAAGVLHGMAAGDEMQRVVEFATAAAAIKHSIPGDFNIASVADVERAMAEDGLDVRR